MRCNYLYHASKLLHAIDMYDA
ncbi:hypothetical protein RHCRD62_80215 [Rhodococcus sp. RD6.2]|nr:hypothetical protein RHCRD62_80215 [Rhodococcus sp. RD6.2]